jgi:WD40 repeat protein
VGDEAGPQFAVEQDAALFSVRAVDFSPDGARVVSGGDDGTVRL